MSTPDPVAAPPTNSFAKRALLPVAIVTAVIVAVAAGAMWQRHHKLNFSVVEPGILYRSGQPDGAQLRDLVAKHRIRTVINLREMEKNRKEGKALREAAYARQSGLILLYYPVSDTPSLQQVQDFLALVKDPANRPVLIHCAAGKERTGMMVGIYRIVVNDWSPEETRAEMLSYGYLPSKNPRYWDYVVTTAEQIKKGQAAAESR